MAVTRCARLAALAITAGLPLGRQPGWIDTAVQPVVRLGVHAALSRLGAVAVVMRPDTDLSASVRLGRVTEILTDPTNLDAARQLPGQVLVLGGGEASAYALGASTCG